MTTSFKIPALQVTVTVSMMDETDRSLATIPVTNFNASVTNVPEAEMASKAIHAIADLVANATVGDVKRLRDRE